MAPKNEKSLMMSRSAFSIQCTLCDRQTKLHQHIHA